ncbi:uncharacterized protein LOC129290375 [Prosopis cineraria]|uniref:uncharacterized protein LOC129290375 n=1 Tax=Prosopis cineraria TaxID=364024 RepID=UPI00240EF41A|nr:uncharacterized protein LOC129290375 [Prosopis cineraria]
MKECWSLTWLLHPLFTVVRVAGHASECCGSGNGFLVTHSAVSLRILLCYWCDLILFLLYFFHLRVVSTRGAGLGFIRAEFVSWKLVSYCFLLSCSDSDSFSSSPAFCCCRWLLWQGVVKLTASFILLAAIEDHEWQETSSLISLCLCVASWLLPWFHDFLFPSSCRFFFPFLPSVILRALVANGSSISSGS